MAKQPRVVIQLDDGTNTYVAVSPVRPGGGEWAYRNVCMAAGEVLALFLHSVIEEKDIVNEHLEKFRG